MIAPRTRQLSRPSAATALVLSAGRGGFRLGQWISAAVLFGVWGQEQFAAFAAAVAGSQWLTAIASAGVEKTMIAWSPLPCGQAARRQLLVWVLLGAVVIMGVAAVLGLVDDALRPWMLALIYGVALGAALVAIAALRLTGKFCPDLVVMSSIGATHLGAAGLTFFAGCSVVLVLLVLAVTTLVVASLAILAAWRSSRRSMGPEPPVRAVLLRDMFFTGASEICNMVAVAVVYAILASTDHAAQAAYLYVASLVGQIAIGATAYLMRLAGASLATTAKSQPEQAALQTVRQFRGCAVVATLHLGAMVGLLATTLPVRFLVPLVTLLGVLPTLLVLRASAWAEYGSSTGRRVAAKAAAVGLVTATGSAALLVPATGATGGIIGLQIGTVVQALTAALLLSGVARSPGTVTPAGHRTGV